MTREQDFERRLAEWLEAGPVTAPTEVVDRAVEKSAGRPQRRGTWRWLILPVDRIGRWFPVARLARATVLSAVIAGILLTSLLVSVPFGGPGPAPEMDASVIRTVTGTAQVGQESEGPTELTRLVDVRTGDPRVDGRARQELTVLLDTEAGMHRSQGTMRLENTWGAWEGPVELAVYPSGEEFELASLTGSGAYAGYTYLYATHHFLDEAERVVEGAIWPIEPPSIPDPSHLP